MSFRLLRAKILGSALVATLEICTAAMAGNALRPNLSSSASGEVSSVASDHGAPSGTGGNLVVSVPLHPPTSALRRLCGLLVVESGSRVSPKIGVPSSGGVLSAGRSAADRPTAGASASGNTVGALIAATGGTVSAALSWCATYLGHHGRRIGTKRSGTVGDPPGSRSPFTGRQPIK